MIRAALAFPLLVSTAPAWAQDPAPLRTRPERTKFEETSRLEDVQGFLRALGAQSDLLRVQSFGTSEEGRPLLLATLSNPPAGLPGEARALERPLVFVQANIHAGEVEGKEAVQNLMRRLTLGDLRPLLDQVVVLVVPVYNVDGNEAVDVQNRTEQYGPIAGVGRRENKNGLDLNRDYMKLESAEARALVHLIGEWDPEIVVDLHTTNGSYHGYHLTYSIPVNLSLEPKLLDFQRGTLMPALAKSLSEGHAFRSYYYGNFAGEGDKRVWEAFDHRPRIGQNYVGLRNRIAILSEAYSYLGFQQRIAVTEAFVEEILRYTAGHAREIRALTRALDADFVQRARGEGELLLGVAYEPRALPEKVPLLVGEVTHEVNPRNQKPMTVMLPDKFTTVAMQDMAYFAPTRSVPMARAYVLPRTEAMRPIVAKLRQHGIEVEELTAELTTELTTFQVETATAAKRPFQGHSTLHLTGKYDSAATTLPTGTIVVRLAQPLGRLAAYLLEPESDDGLVCWNYFDSLLVPGQPAPVRKILRNSSLATRALTSF